MERFVRYIFCAEHGNAEWQGHVVCAQDVGGCGRVFQTKDSAAPCFAPYNCPCGAPLMPGKPVKNIAEQTPSREKVTARAICPRCFEERKMGPS